MIERGNSSKGFSAGFWLLHARWDRIGQMLKWKWNVSIISHKKCQQKNIFCWICFSLREDCSDGKKKKPWSAPSAELAVGSEVHHIWANGVWKVGLVEYTETTLTAPERVWELLGGKIDPWLLSPVYTAITIEWKGHLRSCSSNPPVIGKDTSH